MTTVAKMPSSAFAGSRTTNAVPTSAPTSTPPVVQTFYCTESDVVRQRRASVTSFQRIVNAAVGRVEFEKDGRRVYFSSPDALKVRRTVEVDGVFTDAADDIPALFERSLRPLVNLVAEKHRDLIVLSLGDSTSKKDRLLHGGRAGTIFGGSSNPNATQSNSSASGASSSGGSSGAPGVRQDEAGVLDHIATDRGNWGLAFHVVEALLQLASQHGMELFATACKVHHEHVADALIAKPSTAASTKQQAGATTASAVAAAQAAVTHENGKITSQYLRLQGLAHGATLELDEVAEGRFMIVDQTEVPIRDLEDFAHVAQCVAAVNSAAHPFAKLATGGKRGLPFAYIVTIAVLPVGFSRFTATPTLVHLVQGADSDWKGTGEEVKLFADAAQSIVTVAQHLCRGDVLNAQFRSRDSPLSRIIFSNLRFERGPMVVVYGSANYAHALEMMASLGEAKGQHVSVVLHGPDGEGLNEVDAELRTHVMSVQNQCVSLRTEIALLSAKKEELQRVLRRGKETLVRLEEQQSIVQSVTSPLVRTKSMTGGNKQESADRMKEAARKAAAERRQLKALAIDRDVRKRKMEDTRRAAAVANYIRQLGEETKRCEENCAALEKQAARLRQALVDQDSKDAAEKAALENEMTQSVASLMERNRRDMEAINQAKRTAQSNRQNAIAAKNAVAEEQERMLVDELGKASAATADAADKEKKQWTQELEALGREVGRLEQLRTEYRNKADAAEAQFTAEMRALDTESMLLSKYLADVTRVLWRFEQHNSTIMRELVTIPKCQVRIFDITASHPVEELRAEAARIRRWLASVGVPPPFVFYSFQRDSFRIDEDALRQWTCGPAS